MCSYSYELSVTFLELFSYICNQHLQSFQGELNRTIGEHSLNRHSSRSHCVYTMYVESRSRVQSCSAYTTSKLNLVDLAGSERLSKTKVSCVFYMISY